MKITKLGLLALMLGSVAATSYTADDDGGFCDTGRDRNGSLVVHNPNEPLVALIPDAIICDSLDALPLREALAQPLAQFYNNLPMERSVNTTTRDSDDHRDPTKNALARFVPLVSKTPSTRIKLTRTKGGLLKTPTPPPAPASTPSGAALVPESDNADT